MASSDLTTTMNALVACVSEKLADADRPACRDGLTVGAPATGPQGCCQDCAEGGPGGELTAHLERVYPVDGFSFEQVVQPADCRPMAYAADITLVVVRCYPSMNDQGVMPTPDETTPYAEALNTDLAAAMQGLICCSGFKLVIRESAIDADPEGGCSGFAIRVSVIVSLVTP